MKTRCWVKTGNKGHKDERVRGYGCRIGSAEARTDAERRLDRDLEEFLSERAAEEGTVALDIDLAQTLESCNGEIRF